MRVGPIRPCDSRMAGATTAGLYFVRFLLSAIVAALPTGPTASTQNGESNLNVDELIGVLNAWFGDSHVHSRAVFGVHGRVVLVDFDLCTRAGSSRNVRNFVSQRVVPRRESMSTRAGRGVFAFLVQGGSTLGSVTLPVFASGVAHGSA